MADKITKPKGVGSQEGKSCICGLLRKKKTSMTESPITEERAGRKDFGGGSNPQIFLLHDLVSSFLASSPNGGGGPQVMTPANNREIDVSLGNDYLSVL